MDKENQIEEARKFIRKIPYITVNQDQENLLAQYFVNEGYRKQRVGEWKIKSVIHKLIDDYDEELYVECPFCQRTFWVPYEFDDEKIFKYAREHYPYCNCGAKMKGGEEQ